MFGNFSIDIILFFLSLKILLVPLYKVPDADFDAGGWLPAECAELADIRDG
jgi:hypothetical protein